MNVKQSHTRSNKERKFLPGIIRDNCPTESSYDDQIEAKFQRQLQVVLAGEPEENAKYFVY